MVGLFWFRVGYEVDIISIIDILLCTYKYLYVLFEKMSSVH